MRCGCRTGAWRWSAGPSVSRLRRPWRRCFGASGRRPRRAERPAVLALGDPAFASERAGGLFRETETFRGAFEAAGGLPRLSASGDEVREVARYSPAMAVVRLREDASEAWLKTDAARAVRRDSSRHPRAGGRELARPHLARAGARGGEDGFLSPADLAALRLDADLVVLSACRTAGGVMVAGEGMQGLTDAAHRGRRARRRGDAVADRRPDHRAAWWTTSTPGSGRGLPVAEALRGAKLAAIRRGAPAAEWAAFTVVGDPLVRVRLRAAGSATAAWWWVAGGAAALLLAGYLAVRWRGRRSERSVLASDVVARTHQL